MEERSEDRGWRKYSLKKRACPLYTVVFEHVYE